MLKLSRARIFDTVDDSTVQYSIVPGTGQYSGVEYNMAFRMLGVRRRVVFVPHQIGEQPT